MKELWEGWEDRDEEGGRWRRRKNIDLKQMKDSEGKIRSRGMVAEE